jgi:iron uptake system EfeUOB component EfeO/EfeM
MPLAQALHAIGRAMPRSLDRCLLLPVAAIAFAASTASSGAADTLAKGAEAYKAYVVEQIGSTLAGAKDLQAAIKAGDAKAAQAAWIKSRTGWERIEPITAEFFAELDEAIDSWPDAKRGFHAIEARLFAGNLSDLSAPTDKLVTAVTAFDKAVRAPNFRFSSQGLLDGVTKLAYELGEKKAKGGESPYAGTSLIDMRDNLQGIDALYKTVLQEPLKAKDAKLAQSIDGKIQDIEATLKAQDIKSLDQAKLQKTSEELAVLLQESASKLNLKKPSLSD